MGLSDFISRILGVRSSQTSQPKHPLTEADRKAEEAAHVARCLELGRKAVEEGRAEALPSHPIDRARDRLERIRGKAFTVDTWDMSWHGLVKQRFDVLFSIHTAPVANYNKNNSS